MSETFDFLTFPLHGSRLIEASAGTGKTFSLALLYVRLIIGHHLVSQSHEQTHEQTHEQAHEQEPMRPLLPKEILVVTFTDAAAEELRDRIRQRLVEAATFFQQMDVKRDSDDPLQRLRDCLAEEELAQAAWRLKLASESMDEASIHTIHGWCNKMLVQHAFNTKGLFTRELVTDHRDLFAEVVKDYWRQHFYALDLGQTQALQQSFANPESLRVSLQSIAQQANVRLCYQGSPLRVENFSQVTTCLNNVVARNVDYAEQMAQFTEYQTAFNHLAQQCQQAWGEEWEAIKAFLLSIREHLHGAKYASTTIEKFTQLLAEIEAWAAGHSNKIPSKLKNFAVDAFSFKQNKEQDIPAFSAFGLTAALYQLEKVAKPKLDKQVDKLTTATVLAHAQQWVNTEFSRRRLIKAEMGFDDLLIQLGEAVSSDETLASTLAELFPIAMIDEFQDTDPVQYQIFDAIYQIENDRPNSGVFMIGDPKQAIYSFRGADIYTYLRAKFATGNQSGPRHFTLKKNFRSTANVVAACNYFFGHAEQHPAGAFRFKQNDEVDPIPYPQVEANGREDTFWTNGSAAPALLMVPVYPNASFTNMHEDEDEPHVDEDDTGLISNVDYRVQAAEIAATQVVKWLSQAQAGTTGFAEGGNVTKALKPSDIAILVRSGTEAKAIRDALYRRNVTSVYLSDKESVFASQQASDVLCWLRACAEPFNESLIRAALGTNTLALPFSQLAQWREDDVAWQYQMEVFSDFRKCWRERGVLAMLRELIEHYRLGQHALGQLSDGERVITNVLHIAEWLQQAAIEITGEHALIRHLLEHIQDAGDEQILRLESDADLVKVITIHKSKGLEYPVVMLPFISSWREIDGKTKVVTVAHDPSQAPAQLKGQSPAVTQHGWDKHIEIAGKDDCQQAWLHADNARLNEDLRLLYVALTRASYHLWLGVGALKGRSKSPQVHKSAMGYVLNGGNPFETSSQLFSAYQQLAEGCTDIKWVHDSLPIAQALYAGEQALSLGPARDASGLPKHKPWWVASYSAIKFADSSGSMLATSPMTGVEAEELEQEPETAQQQKFSELQGENKPGIKPQIASEPSLHQFPAGAEWGSLLHSLLEWAAVQTSNELPGERGFAVVAQEHDLRDRYIDTLCEAKGISEHAPVLSQWLVDFINMPWQFSSQLNQSDQSEQSLKSAPHNLCLRDLDSADLLVEMEFMLASHEVSAVYLDQLIRQQTLNGVARPHAQTSMFNGMLKGFIDLTVEYNQRYYVVDWKSNKLGDNDESYSYAAMENCILQHRYDLQYVLYILALHRQLKSRLPNYDYDEHIGGAVYVFLRGHQATTQGLFFDRPSKSLIEQLDHLFRGNQINNVHEGDAHEWR